MIATALLVLQAAAGTDAVPAAADTVLVDGKVVNKITVDPTTAEQARVALQRMLDIT